MYRSLASQDGAEGSVVAGSGNGNENSVDASAFQHATPTSEVATPQSQAATPAPQSATPTSQ
jgi:hypothetical protein